MAPRQPSHPAMTEPTMRPSASATMRAPGSWRRRPARASAESVDVGSAARSQKASTGATSSGVAGRKSACAGTGDDPEPEIVGSAVAARLEHLGPVADVDRHVAGDAECVTQDPTCRVEETLPRLVLHQDDPAEGTQQPDELVGVECHLPGECRLL